MFMGFKQDWMERQIEALGKTLATLIFGKDKIKSLASEIEEDSTQFAMEDEILERLLEEYLKRGEICKAEDLLLNSVEENPTPRKIIAGLKFYSDLEKLSQKFLEENNFSREEIVDGLKRLKTLSDV